jgi:hypothetical protein
LALRLSDRIIAELCGSVGAVASIVSARADGPATASRHLRF